MTFPAINIRQQEITKTKYLKERTKLELNGLRKKQTVIKVTAKIKNRKIVFKLK